MENSKKVRLYSIVARMCFLFVRIDGIFNPDFEILWIIQIFIEKLDFTQSDMGFGEQDYYDGGWSSLWSGARGNSLTISWLWGELSTTEERK